MVAGLFVAVFWVEGSSDDVTDGTSHFCFSGFVRTTSCTYRKTAFLLRFLGDCEPSDVRRSLGGVRTVRRDNSLGGRRVSTTLTGTFIAPISQRSLTLVDRGVSRIASDVRSIFRQFCISRVRIILPRTVRFTRGLVSGYRLVGTALRRFTNFGGPTGLQRRVVRLGRTRRRYSTLCLGTLQTIPSRYRSMLSVLC